MKTILRGCTLAAAIVTATTASAGGLWLNEFGDFAGGRAAAGAAAGVDEAMTLAYNPASISRIKGNQLFVSGGAVVGDMNFDESYSNSRNGGSDGGNAGKATVFSSMAYVHDLGSDKWSAAIGLVPLSGSGFKFDDDWVGRYQAIKVDLLVAALSPTVAYQVTDQLSLGVTVQGYYANLEIDLALPRLDPGRPDGDGSIDGNDMDLGYTLGAMYELAPGSRFGLFYQSELKPKFGGNFKANYSGLGPGEAIDLARNVSTDTELELAEYVRFSVHQDMDERWGVDFTVGWDNWSALSNVLISTQDGAAGVPTRWEDTYHVAWGTQYQLDKYWALTGGVAYDSNPVDSEYRNAQLPVDRQIRYAVGARYALRDNLTVGGYVNYIDLGKARITGKRFGGDFDNNSATQLIANLTWKF